MPFWGSVNRNFPERKGVVATLDCKGGCFGQMSKVSGVPCPLIWLKMWLFLFLHQKVIEVARKR